MSASAPPNPIVRDGEISIGLIAPVRRASATSIDFREQVDIAAEADALGFAAWWVRDVPLNGSWYPEEFGHLDPFVALGAVAARTRRIAFGTAATVLPLRHALHVAKAAASLQALSGERLLLGLGAGDRPQEFAAFGESLEDRGATFRERWAVLAAALRSPEALTMLGEDYDLHPAPFAPPPLYAIGSAGQTVDWIARNAGGWFTYHREPAGQRDRHAIWRSAVERHAADAFRAFGVAVQIELTDESGPAAPIDLGYRTGVQGLTNIIDEQRRIGVHHLIISLRPTATGPDEAIARVAEAARNAGAMDPSPQAQTEAGSGLAGSEAEQST
ncbi:LLM class flavin-dependent oxidoreductase [Acuticoccus sp. M5D2P5]|uniref:LLM class flavin-dependent oxidoreductase n=1 Tax=Acuticoccus kalidii TaxID=2910977 RepID=UPI001F490CA9|nr:LLM class flavin-dependent oxidoreductase [Acuticoccus kalidii]MCF3934069.1 LLM class flavin-dependent oxidoreductase [Acuticoccus kalidii]